MDRSQIGKLLGVISIHYPGFKGGHNPEATAEEWYRIIGYLDYEDALRKLDEYMASDDGRKPPMAMDFRKSSGSAATAREYFHAETRHQWHLEFMRNDPERTHGRLYDEEGREYVHDPVYEDGYHYDYMGRICTMSGKVVFG